MHKVVIIALSVLITLIFTFFAASSIGNYVFDKDTKREIEELFNSNIKQESEVVQNADLEGLPPIVQKWLEQSQVIGKERIRTVRIKQNAFLRLKEEGAWMPTEAEQYFAIDRPGFIWKARVKMAPLLFFAGRDMYYEGKGHMLIKLQALVKIADARGKEIDQGTMLRYMAEMVWFPTAALSNYIVWEEINDNSARAIMSYNDMTVSGVFTFNEKGEVISLVAERYGEFDGQYLMRTWSVLMRQHQEFNGIKIPSKGEVVWSSDTGDFNWYQFDIISIDYNKPFVY